MIDVKNDMEHLVRREVARRRGDPKAPREACWCALCEADIIALALNNLPPRYCRGANFGYAAAEGFRAEVRAAVTQALAKVSRRPKHRPGAPDRFRSDVHLEDYALRIGASLVSGAALPGDSARACACEGCLADALALALNRYPPKYGVSSPGRASFQENYEDFIRHELGQELERARHVIGSNPSH